MQVSDANNIWHPYTQMKTAAKPIHISRGAGALLFGEHGETYIDAISSWWVNIHGHSNPIIAKSIADQAGILEQVIFAGFTHSPAINLADNLLSILPSNFSKVFFSDNGSTAVEVAIKMALQYWHNKGFKSKTRLIAFEGAYHGDTFGAMSAGARGPFNAAFNSQLFEVNHIKVPNKYNLESVKNDFLALISDGNAAAFIFEPLIQGAAGMQMHEAQHLDELLGMAKEHQVLCIADEVMTGFGRTGKNFACQHLKQEADIICLSKGITGGFLPLGVTCSTNRIYEAFLSDNAAMTFYHGHSYTANPLACAAANASITILNGTECQTQITNICESHQKFAQKLKLEDRLENVRQTGTILAFDIKTKEDTSYFNSVRNSLYKYCLSESVLLRPLGNVVYIMPPYCITQDELNMVYEVILKLLDKLEKENI